MNRRRKYYADKGDTDEGPDEEHSGHDNPMVSSSNIATANQTVFAGRETNTSPAAEYVEPYRLPHSPEATGVSKWIYGT